MFCEKCGYKIGKNSRFCEQCGNSVLRRDNEDVINEDLKEVYKEKQNDIKIDYNEIRDSIKNNNYFREEIQNKRVSKKNYLKAMGTLIIILVLVIANIFIFKNIFGNKSANSNSLNNINDIENNTNKQMINNNSNFDSNNNSSNNGENKKYKHSYKLIQANMNWQEAKDYCESLGGHLATITSKEEENEVLGIVTNSDIKVLWLGANDLNETGNFKWVTNEAFTYSNWAPNEPNNEKNIEHYLVLYKVEGEWLWNDGPLNTNEYYKSENIGFICEWETEEW